MTPLGAPFMLLILSALLPAQPALSAASASGAPASAAGAAAAAVGEADPAPAAQETGTAEDFLVVAEEAEPSGTRSAGGRLAGLAGRMHPALTHFPVAWILLAAGFEWAALLSAWRRPGNGRSALQAARREWTWDRRFGTASLMVLILAAVSSLAAAGTGYLRSLDAEPEALLIRHGRMAYATVALGMLALGARLFSLKPGRRAWRLAAAILLAAAAATVGYAGHLGGSLIFGEGYPWADGG